MAEVKNTLKGLKTTSRTSSSWRFAFPLLYIGMMTFNQSGFSSSPFVELYLLFVPILFIGYCCVAFVRSWHATPTGLSKKALLFITKKQFDPFLFVLVLFTISVSLLYAIVAHPPTAMIHVVYLWVTGTVLIVILLLFCITMLK